MQEIQSQFNFEKIIIVPSKFPPGKEVIAPYDIRLSWCKSLFTNSRFEVSDLESSAAHTVFAKQIVYQTQLAQPHAVYFWILGEDQWNQLPYWRDIDEYGKDIRWLVMKRDFLTERPKTGLLSKRLLGSSCPYYWAQISKRPDISSTGIRSAAQESNEPKAPQKDWVPEKLQKEVWNFYFENTHSSKRKT